MLVGQTCLLQFLWGWILVLNEILVQDGHWTDKHVEDEKLIKIVFPFITELDEAPSGRSLGYRRKKIRSEHQGSLGWLK